MLFGQLILLNGQFKVSNVVFQFRVLLSLHGKLSIGRFQLLYQIFKIFLQSFRSIPSFTCFRFQFRDLLSVTFLLLLPYFPILNDLLSHLLFVSLRCTQRRLMFLLQFFNFLTFTGNLFFSSIFILF